MQTSLKSPDRIARSTATALLLGLLVGCSLGPQYKRPTFDLPTAYTSPIKAAQVWPSSGWWRGFGSADLNGLIDDARGNNPDIQAAIARVQQADAQVSISGAPLLPTISGSAQANWSRQSFQTVSRTQGGSSATLAAAGRSTRAIETRFYNLSPNASYELDFWGRLRATQQSAEASALFSRYDQETVALTALTSVATTWFTALAFQDRLNIAQRNLRDAEYILGAIQGRLDAGTASLLDLSQQQALVAGIRAQIPGLRSQLEQELIGLAILVGHPPEAMRVRPGTLNTLSLPPVAPGLPSELLTRRPDVASAEANLLAANANIRVARANFFPQVVLTGSAGWESVALGTLFGPGGFLASAAASATQTLFDNGLKAGQFEQAKGRYNELVADYRKSVLQAFTDVEDALTALRFATEQEAREREAVATAQRAADIARAQVVAGTLDIVTALQTQTTLFTDLDLLAQARLARFLALVNLYKALGGGWTRADVTAPPSTIFHGVL